MSNDFAPVFSALRDLMLRHADGLIVAGESGIDESPVTGESVPVRKGPDATVFAGTVNGEAALRVRAKRPGVGRRVARISISILRSIMRMAFSPFRLRAPSSSMGFTRYL